MYLERLVLNGNDIIESIDVSLINPKTNQPYSVIAFVGENGCGKTTLLNEIEKIPNKHYLYLRQNSMFVGVSNESYNLTSGGGDLYEVQNSKDLTGGLSVFSLRSNNVVNNKSACLKLLEELNDEQIKDIYESGKLDHSRCGGKAVSVIDGRNDFFDLNNLSSGQQEILLKIKTLKKMNIATDYILLDEPETSLHPSWQKIIVDLLRNLVKDSNGNIPQVFLATHSELVLESLINRDDALIIHLFKKGRQKRHELINSMDLRLPNPTYPELNYLIFHMDSLEYHDLLFIRIQDLIESDRVSDVDKFLKGRPEYNRELFGKKWTFQKKNGKTETYRTLPAYIRNYFHHPKEDLKPTDDELNRSILFLRNILKDLEE